jgi:hypothetical protein
LFGRRQWKESDWSKKVNAHTPAKKGSCSIVLHLFESLCSVHFITIKMVVILFQINCVISLSKDVGTFLFNVRRVWIMQYFSVLGRTNRLGFANDVYKSSSCALATLHNAIESRFESRPWWETIYIVKKLKSQSGKDPVQRLLNLQIQRQRCSSLERFFKVEENIFVFKTLTRLLVPW